MTSDSADGYSFYCKKLHFSTQLELISSPTELTREAVLLEIEAKQIAGAPNRSSTTICCGNICPKLVHKLSFYCRKRGWGKLCYKESKSYSIPSLCNALYYLLYLFLIAIKYSIRLGGKKVLQNSGPIQIFLVTGIKKCLCNLSNSSTKALRKWINILLTRNWNAFK